MTRMLAMMAALAISAPAAWAQQSAGQATADTEGLVLEGVTVESPGYLVVTAERPEDATASQPVAIAEDPIAVTEVQPGENQNLRIPGSFPQGSRYVVHLYEESGIQDGFQWEEGVEDLPVSEDGEHVTTTFDMMMEAGEPASDS